MVITIKELTDVLCIKEPRMKREEATECAQTILDIFGYSLSVTDAALRASLGVHSQHHKATELPNSIRNILYHLEELEMLNTETLETTLPVSGKSYRVHYWNIRPDWNKTNGHRQKLASKFTCYDGVPEDVFREHAAKAEAEAKAIAL